ncbi:BglG family transcription antiterminator [Radiobacillus kanasensis]|uniref:BglG family transcription antiterminator n=1 Tax=Radiobacillus kanasensis TaxID=2844358 RepID=UPI001E30C7FA|nr:BglG family transcription antiterminator [Radiobacillus kanasensis]UFT99889.1 BglG family transcription antiterminator [Radiobacillus kanasensis]
MMDERSTIILSKLAQTQDYLSLKYLTETLGVSRRTLYYDLEKINDWLADNQMQQVKHASRKGYFLEPETKLQLSKQLGQVDEPTYYYSKKERYFLMIVLTLTSADPLFMKDFEVLTKVSRGTIANDLKEITQYLKQTFELNLSFHRKDGYGVSGREFEKRKALASALEQLLLKWKWEDVLKKFPTLFFEHGDTLQKREEIRSILLDGEQELGNELTDETLSGLSMQILIVIKRVREGHFVQIDSDEKSVLKTTREHRVAEKLIQKLSKQENVNIPLDETYFITMHVLGSKVNTLEIDSDKNQEMERLKHVITLMIKDFQNYACVMFQDVMELKRAMFAHLKPAYYRIKYGVKTMNELTETISSNYPEIFQLTAKVVSHLENLLHQKVNDSEIAYIAMHFGGWLKREGKKPIRRTRALIVCENGIGTSTILRGQLEHLLSTVDIIGNVSLRQYQQTNYEVDIIFSTSPIMENSIPVVMVNPILTDAEKEALLSRFSVVHTKREMTMPKIPGLMDVIRRHANIVNEKQLGIELEQLFQQSHSLTSKEFEKPMLNELLTKDMIQIVSEVKDWEESINLASKPLLEKEYVSDSYVKAMIQNIQELGPYVVIAPKIAIPHARPEFGVNRLGMSLLLVQDGVKFSEQEKHFANLIIVLAAIDNETHLKALSQLTDLLSDKESLDKLLTMNSAEEVADLIQNYSYA